MNDVSKYDVIIRHLVSSLSDFDWPDVSYFQAKFDWERGKGSKIILYYSKLSRFDKPFGGGLAPL